MSPNHPRDYYVEGDRSFQAAARARRTFFRLYGHASPNNVREKKKVVRPPPAPETMSCRASTPAPAERNCKRAAVTLSQKARAVCNAAAPAAA